MLKLHDFCNRALKRPTLWQAGLSRIEGALPFLSDPLSKCLAQRSLRQLWRLHIQDYPPEDTGKEFEAKHADAELIGTRYEGHRARFLTWLEHNCERTE